MSECYCAKIDGGTVSQVIVCGDSGWASRTLGGEWVCTGKTLVGVGWLYDGETFVAPQETSTV